MISAAALALSLSLAAAEPPKSRPYLEAALCTGRWLAEQRLETAYGSAWKMAPGEVDEGHDYLYSGGSGVVLFFLELARASGDESWRELARLAADGILERISIDDDLEGAYFGLYVGLAGEALVLEETYRATAEERYRQGALRLQRFIERGAIQHDRGIDWGPYYDIVAGSAGTGLYLLYAAERMGEPKALELAQQVGDRLLDLARPENVGSSWLSIENDDRVMPNFSHGTAGIAYFLASLYLATGERAYLNAALAGGRHLRSIARLEGEACLIHRHTPGAEQIYYLSWCHGPAGTGRLFYRLYQATGDRTWLTWLDRGATAILESGIPEQRNDGFWNNVSRCCGTAGVLDFVLGLDRLRGERRFRPFAERLAADLFDHATKSTDGWSWRQAEHRVRPELLMAQTGLMQGAAGIGLSLLNLDAFDRGEDRGIRLPDDPF